MEGVLVATSQDGEVSANLTDDHGLTGAMRLCDVNPGRITAVTCPASDVGLDTVSAAHVSDVVDLGELSQRSFGGVGAVIVSTIHLKVMLPRHPESSVGVKLGSTTEGHKGFIDVIGIDEVGVLGGGLSSIRDLDPTDRITFRGEAGGFDGGIIQTSDDLYLFAPRRGELTRPYDLRGSQGLHPSLGFTRHPRGTADAPLPNEANDSSLDPNQRRCAGDDQVEPPD
jgi:hypothetical protein